MWSSFFADLLVVLVPSWRFFDQAGVVPSIQIRGRAPGPSAESDWREFNPPPSDLSVPCRLLRLFFNPEGNERLYLLTCAERLLNEISSSRDDGRDWSASAHYRILVERCSRLHPNGVQFRLVTTSEEGREDVVFISKTHSAPSPRQGRP